MSAEYQVFAIRYATREARRAEQFIGGYRTTTRCRWTISSGWRRTPTGR